jgi:hypothetical protein
MEYMINNYPKRERTATMDSLEMALKVADDITAELSNAIAARAANETN